MGYTVSTRFHTALGKPHTTVAWLDLYSRGSLVENQVPFNRDASSVSDDFVSGARRTATIGVPYTRQWLTWLGLPALELRPFAGVSFGHGAPEMCPMGVFPVRTRPRKLIPGELSLQCVDRWEGVAAWGFLTPQWSPVGLPVPAAIAQLIQDTSIDEGVRNEATSLAPTPSVLWVPGTNQRSQVITDLAQTVAAEVFVDRFGVPVVRDRRLLWPSVVLRPGVGGTVVDVVADIDLAKVINAVSVSSTNTDVVFDTVMVAISDPTDPAHKDNVGGTRSEAYSSSALTGVDHARQVGLDRLVKQRGFARQLSITIVPDYSLDAGDVVDVHWDQGGDAEFATIQSLNTPLGKGNQTITTVNTRAADLT